MTTTSGKQPNTLVVGSTGSIGYAVTANLLARQWPVTILVRNRAKADKLFPNQTTLTIVEGDAQDTALLNRVAADKTHVFHGINYPYNEWFGNMAEPIREDSVPNSNTRKGKLRIELEAMLERAANAGTGRVLTIRLPDFFGPNVLNEGIKPIFMNAQTGKAVPWLINIDIPHQLVYTPDAAEIIVRLMVRGQHNPYDVWNYGGRTVPSIRSWFGQISAITGKPLKTQIYSRFIISMLGLFMPVLREVKEMLYLYENTILLNDDKVQAAFPDFQPTPMKQALTETLDWFRKQAGK